MGVTSELSTLSFAVKGASGLMVANIRLDLSAALGLNHFEAFDFPDQNRAAYNDFALAFPVSAPVTFTATAPLESAFKTVGTRAVDRDGNGVRLDLDLRSELRNVGTTETGGMRLAGAENFGTFNSESFDLFEIFSSSVMLPAHFMSGSALHPVTGEPLHTDTLEAGVIPETFSVFDRPSQTSMVIYSLTLRVRTKEPLV